jgi:hypothetical protein
MSSVTLEAYQNLYTGLVSYLADGATTYPPTGPIPEDLTKKAISLQVRPPVWISSSLACELTGLLDWCGV